MLGGSSSSNYMVYLRGNRFDYERWVQAGNTGWDYASNLPYFKKSEGNVQRAFVEYKNGFYHNDSGPLKVDIFGNLTTMDEMFIDAGSEFGIPYINDMNADQTIGFVNLQGNLYQGRRVSSAKAFLIPAKNRKNLNIIKHALVEKILINKTTKRAYGVKFRIGKHKLKVFARKEVILSAGSVMSPVLLMLSGIGPAKHLTKHKIPIKADLPVGRHLIDHIYAAIWFKFNPTATSPSAKLDSIYNFAIHNTGSLVSTSQITAIFSTNGSIVPDVQIVFHPFTQNSPDLASYSDSLPYKQSIKSQLLEANKKFDLVSIDIVLLHPKSSGRIKLNGTCICNKPNIYPKYYTQRDDMEILLKATKEQLAWIETQSYQENGGEFLKLAIKECDQFTYLSDAYLECYIQYFSTSTFHPAGTSKMGPQSDPSTVVDPQLKVHGVNGLRQIDAGV